MSWPASETDLAKLGKTICKEAKGVFTDAHVAFGELTLTGPAARIVRRICSRTARFSGGKSAMYSSMLPGLD